jgi:hypothetical protein
MEAMAHREQHWRLQDLLEEKGGTPMKWKLDEIDVPGPMQVKKVKKAVDAVTYESMKHTEIDSSGIRFTVTVIGLRTGAGPSRQDCADGYQQLGNAFNWTISKSNAKHIQTAAAALLQTLVNNRPIITKEVA